MTDSTTARLLDAAAAGLEIFDLGRTLTVGMPQSPNHPAYWHALPRRHGDMVRSDGGSAANDMISMGTHVGTHIDALSHVSQDGKLHGDLDAEAAQVGGRFLEHGAHTIKPMVRRGVLLDVPGTLGVDRLEPGQEITVADLEATLAAQGTEIREGDVVLVRSGWGQHFDNGDGDLYRGLSTGVPGVSEAGAAFLAGHGIHATGADTIAYEQLKPGAGHGLLPAHRVLLVESGIYIIEAMDLEALAAAGVHEFLFVLSPLKFFGATGSPVRPLAVVGA
ncbi:cyclase family protein [Nocardioides sp. dk4132]|jgi:kynurenine formamidase|uniref:cyclase family protein n=1 Tax=unclassified Nocardioides TaxID=2615069 RepID=UPI001295F01F|nr:MULTISPECIES: cyclase family protein [unclassified Nocardioides]MQW76804.1 cyclase family protein [Nocardioides sp. dk4132]QGA06845.1 cyclase family protein [Nocardioides sp. dk884]